MATLLSPLAMAPVAAVELPDLGAPSSSVSEGAQLKLGRAWLRAFRSKVGVDEDAAIELYVEQLMHRLAAAGPTRSHPLEVFLVYSPKLNAFALPGGIIGIHTGLLLYMRDESELASVMAHELSHLQLNHFERRRAFQESQQLPVLASLLASILLVVTVDPLLGLSTMSAAQAAVIEQQLSYSREHEIEADRGGMRLLLAAGYNPDAALHGIERLQEAARFAQHAPEFLLTHPLHERRLASLREAAQEHRKAASAPPPESLPFDLVRTRVVVAHSEDPKKTLAAFTATRQQNPTDQAAIYGHALALAAMRKPKQAWQAIAPLLEAPSPPLEVVATAAKLAAEADALQPALALLRHHRRLNPDNYLLDLSYARLVLRAGDVRSALRVARRQTVLRPRKVAAWQALAASYGAAGTLSGVSRAQAEEHVLSGRLSEAKRLLTRARQLSRSYREQAEIQQRLSELQDLDREQRALLSGG